MLQKRRGGVDSCQNSVCPVPQLAPPLDLSRQDTPPSKIYPPFDSAEFTTECTKIAHCHSLAIFAADSGIAGLLAVGISFAPSHCRRKKRRSLAKLRILRPKNRAILQGAVKIAAASAENRAILVHSVVNKSKFSVAEP